MTSAVRIGVGTITVGHQSGFASQPMTAMSQISFDQPRWSSEYSLNRCARNAPMAPCGSTYRSISAGVEVRCVVTPSQGTITSGTPQSSSTCAPPTSWRRLNSRVWGQCSAWPPSQTTTIRSAMSGARRRAEATFDMAAMATT